MALVYVTSVLRRWLCHSLPKYLKNLFTRDMQGMQQPGHLFFPLEKKGVYCRFIIFYFFLICWLIPGRIDISDEYTSRIATVEIGLLELICENRQCQPDYFLFNLCVNRISIILSSEFGPESHWSVNPKWRWDKGKMQFSFLAFQFHSLMHNLKRFKVGF